MDTSETYIKMCEKATEIQEMRKVKFHSFCIEFPWQNGDWYVGDSGEIKVHHEFACGSTGDYIWLPRQDQLQEMERRQGEFSYVLAFRFDQEKPDFIKDLKWSMEQMWLAFVMSEKYNKSWNGEDWV